MTLRDPETADANALPGLISGQTIVAAMRQRKSRFYESTFPSAEEEMRLENGWELVRTNKSTVRMRKPKPVGEQLEDEIWMLLARMGFKQINKDNRFRIPIASNGSGAPTKQIDVFAVDDETAIVVECKAAETLRSRSLQKDLGETRALQEPIRQAVHRHVPGDRRRVIFVYATRNIDWSEPDRARAREFQIAVLRDRQLDYYDKLVRILQSAARYQLLGDLLQGSTISGLNETVSAVRGRFGKNRFYQFTIEPEKLLKLAYVSHRGSSEEDPVGTYQRLLGRNRLKAIAEHIEKHNGGIFPTNVVVNFRPTRPLRFEASGPAAEDSTVFGTLYLPNTYRSAYLIDGQHRLYGFARTEFASKGKVPVLAFEGLTAAEEVNMFVDINSKQVRVPKGLLVELEPEILDPTAGPQDKLRQLNSRVAANLATKRSSPLYDLVAGEWGSDSTSRPITRPSLRDAVRDSQIVGRIAAGVFAPGSLYSNDDSSSVDRCSQFVEAFLLEVSRGCPEHWGRLAGPGGFLCTNNGITALLRFVREALSYELSRRNISEPWKSSPHELLDLIKYLLEPIVDYFAGADADAVMKEFRQRDYGSSGYRNSAMRVMALVHEKFQKFDPEGLSEFLAQSNEGNIETARNLVGTIENVIRDVTFRILDERYEGSVDDWWRPAIPQNIRRSASARMEESDEGGEAHEFLNLVDYKTIADSNWQDFDNIWAMSPTDRSKRAQLGWFDRLNTLRNRLSHTGRRYITPEELDWLGGLSAHVATVSQRVSS